MWYHPIVQIALERLRAIHRKPQSLMWAYCVPVGLAPALAAAFGSGRSEPWSVAIEEGGLAPTIAQVLAANTQFRINIAGSSQCRAQLRSGKSLLIVTAPILPDAGITYTFEPHSISSVLARS